MQSAGLFLISDAEKNSERPAFGGLPEGSKKCECRPSRTEDGIRSQNSFSVGPDGSGI